MVNIDVHLGGTNGTGPSRMVSNVVRLCRVSEVDYGRGIVSTEWMDQAGQSGPDIPIPHPFAGRAGEGVYVGIRPGTVVAVAMSSHERYVMATTVPLPGMYSSDVASVDEAQFDDTGFPFLDDGDVVLQSADNAQFRLDGDGFVILDNGLGEGFTISGDPDDSTRASVFQPTPVEYSVSQTGISAEGLIRRDIRVEDGEDDFTDFLIDLDSEAVLEEVGWDPSRDVVYFSREASASGTDSGEDKRVRNPGFVEKRETILEYGRLWDVEDYTEELDRLETDKNKPLVDLSERRQRRSNVLSLSLTHPNELMENVTGTLVDVFGNVLDINKNVIPVPKGTTSRVLLENIMENTRRSVAYHMEINTRKGWRYNEEVKVKPDLLRSAPKIKVFANNARDRSRWAMRVDKEGLTTINIPATSETGNIPLLTRQETSSVLDVNDEGRIKSEDGRARDDTRFLFRNDKNKDIFHEQVGPGGITIKGPSPQQVENRLSKKQGNWQESSDGEDVEQVRFEKFIEAGTAFHNIVNTAKTLLEEDIVNKRASTVFLDDKWNATVSGFDGRTTKGSNTFISSSSKFIEDDEVAVGDRFVILDDTDDGYNTKIAPFVYVKTIQDDTTLLLEKGPRGSGNSYNAEESNLGISFSIRPQEAGPTAIASEVSPLRTTAAVRDKELTGLIEGQPNAGGRSAQLNLDGSLEMSIGANTIDRVSWVIDTAGAVVSRLGRDRFGRSAIIHADGDIAIEVGGFDYVGESARDETDTRFVGRGEGRPVSLPKDQRQFRSGKIIIRVRRANEDRDGPDEDGDDTFLVIDETGLTIKTASRLNLVSDQDMVFKAPRIILNGETIQFFEDNPRFLSRSGRVVL